MLAELSVLMEEALAVVPWVLMARLVVEEASLRSRVSFLQQSLHALLAWHQEHFWVLKMAQLE